MGYDALADRLPADDGSPRVVTLADGSVDSYCAAFDDEGDRIERREGFGRRIASGDHATVPIERESREPGGQAVNMARQAHALGAETTAYGHLDDPVFDGLPFETASMGEPSRISVFSFDDDDLMLSRRSADVGDWSLTDLEAAAPSGDARTALSADAVCCGNWASLEGLTDAIEALADALPAVETFVLDPGPVRTRSLEAVADLLAALGSLAASIEVVYSVNRSELEYTADAIAASDRFASDLAATSADSDADDTSDDRDGDDVAADTDGDEESDLERLATVRESAGITAAVIHETDIAAAATREDETVVGNLAVDDPERRTGAGDRFSAGLAVARARDWDWETALALGNCAASYYVATGETGTRGDFRSFLSSRNED